MGIPDGFLYSLLVFNWEGKELWPWDGQIGVLLTLQNNFESWVKPVFWTSACQVSWKRIMVNIFLFPKTMDGGSWHCARGRDQDHTQEKEMQKGQMVLWRGLTNRWEKKRRQGKEEKERSTHLNVEFQRIARKNKKAFLSDQHKEIEGNNRMGKTRYLLNKNLH